MSDDRSMARIDAERWVAAVTTDGSLSGAAAKEIDNIIVALERQRDGAEACIGRYGDAGALAALKDANARAEAVEAALEQARRDAAEVALMLLQNDKDGALQWAKNLDLTIGKNGEPTLKAARNVAAPSGRGGDE